MTRIVSLLTQTKETPMSPDQIAAVRAVAAVLTDTVREMGPEGCPSGHLYAAVMSKLTLSQYEQIIGALVGAGRLRKSGHVLYAV